MNPTRKVLSTDGLFKVIISFLDFPDVLSLSSVNKVAEKFSNTFFYLHCMNYYSSNNDDYSLYMPNRTDKFLEESLLSAKDAFIASINWKKFFVIGNKIKYIFKDFNDKCFQKFAEDSAHFSHELFSTLKEFIALPELRKENLYLESSLNTHHQKFLYDLLYETQNSYFYYQEQLTLNPFSVKCKNEKKLFAHCFSNLSFFYNMSEEDAKALKEFRYYTINIQSFKIKGKSQKEFESFCLNFISNFNEYFNHYIACKTTSQNPLITLLTGLYMSLVYFCSITYIDLKKSKGNSLIFLDKLVNKYQTFNEAAIYLNSEFENVNSLVNIVYERLFTGSKKVNPQFTIYRFMMLTYNKLVLSQFSEETQSILSKIYANFTRMQLKKVVKEKCTEMIFDDDLNSESTYDTFLSDVKSANNVTEYDEDVAKKIIEITSKVPMIYLDMVCNEYLVFYINSSLFPVHGEYERIMNDYNQTNKSIINSLYTKEDCIDILNYFRDDELINSKVINTTKLNFIMNIVESIKINARKDFYEDLNRYLEKRSNEEDVEMVDTSENEIEKNMNDFSICDEALDYLKFDLQFTEERAKEVLIKFLKETNFFKSNTFQVIQLAKEWAHKELAEQKETDIIVSKENQRRNILLKHQNEKWDFNIN